MGQDCLSHLERVYVDRLDVEIVIDDFSSKKIVPSDLFPTNF